MRLNPATSKFIILNLMGLAGLIVAVLQGWIADIWHADATNLVAFIVIVFTTGLYFAAVKDWDVVKFIADNLLMLGLIGTVIGFKIAISGVDPSTAGDVSAISPMVATLISGIYVSIDTTLAGMLGFLWLHLNRFLLS